jgi:outer membrane protein assembly factor BamA
VTSYPLILVALAGLSPLPAQVVPAEPIKPLEAAPSVTQQNPFEAVAEPPRSTPSKVPGPLIETIEFRGTRRIPQLLLRTIIAARVGDAYDPEMLGRVAQDLYSTKRFSHVSWRAEPGAKGSIVRFTVVERPLVESIEFRGDDIVNTHDVLERLKQRKVKLGVETLLDETELGHAATTVREFLAERGRADVQVSPLVEPVSPPLTVKIIFKAEKQ